MTTSPLSASTQLFRSWLNVLSSETLFPPQCVVKFAIMSFYFCHYHLLTFSPFLFFVSPCLLFPLLEYDSMRAGILPVLFIVMVRHMVNEQNMSVKFILTPSLVPPACSEVTSPHDETPLSVGIHRKTSSNTCSL